MKRSSGELKTEMPIKLPIRTIQFLTAIGLYLLLSQVVHATSCVTLPSDTMEEVFAESAGNIFHKGILIGMIVSALVANLFILARTKRWVRFVALLTVSIPIPVIYLFAEIMSSGCTYGHGMAASYYLLPLSALLMLLIAQGIWRPGSGPLPEQPVNVTIFDKHNG